MVDIIKISLENILNKLSLSKLDKNCIDQNQLKYMGINLKQIISVDNKNIFSGVEIPRNEIIKDITIKKFSDIENWNYDKNGFYFQAFSIKYKIKNFYINGIFECSKKTNKKMIFYITYEQLIFN